MRKFALVVLALLLLSGVAMAKEVYVTNNTVTYNSVGTIVTFNTVVNKILVLNNSSTDTIGLQFDSSRIGWNSDNTVYTLPHRTNIFRLSAGSSVSLDISTDQIGYLFYEGTTGTGTLQYLATSDSRVAND